MTPENLAKAAVLHEQLQNLERFQLKLSSARNVDVFAYTGIGIETERFEVEREQGVLWFQELINTIKGEMRSLGVVFEPQDAVMPEVRGHGGWGAEIQVDGKRPEWLRDDDRMQWRGKGYTPNWDTGVNFVYGRDFGSIATHIRLPADHPYYRAAEPEKLFSDDVDPASRDPKTPENLTITITGPQGCGKTVVADWLRGVVGHWNGSPAANAEHRFWATRVAFKDKRVTIIDGAE